jgi:hypothetical protein
MKVKQGGTQIYCPHCGEVRVCQVVQIRGKGLKASRRRWYKQDYPDIQWFRRVRFCNVCSTDFVTAEVNEDFLAELVNLRSALADIKINAGQYLKESDSAAKLLKKLSKFLSGLKALDIYGKAK